MEIKVRGLKEIEAQLVALGSKEGTKILRASMLKASEPILSRARSNVAAISGGSGALHKSLGMAFFVGKPGEAASRSGGISLPALGGKFTVSIGSYARDKTATALHNLFYGRKRKGIYYGHLIEFGHKIVRRTGSFSEIRKRGRKYRKAVTRQVGSAPAHPFLLPALRAAKETAIAIMVREMEDGIARQLRKNAKK